VTLVPLTPITAVARYWAVMNMMPPPSPDQVPRLMAFRAEHPDIEIASPADSRTGMWSAYQGGKILAVNSACASWSTALTSCSRPVRRSQRERPRSRSGIAGASRMPRSALTTRRQGGGHGAATWR
jgi:hypothetical protein